MASLMDMLTGGDEFDLEREEAEYPTAHDNIDNLISKNKLNNLINNMKVRRDLGMGVYEAKDGTIWNRAGVDGKYTYYGGHTEEELDELGRRQKSYEDANMAHKEKVNKWLDIFK
tara:strand:+ start:133 stop:477 length:345 start_codon:yes stop_codon:yes gene_type:complete